MCGLASEVYAMAALVGSCMQVRRTWPGGSEPGALGHRERTGSLRHTCRGPASSERKAPSCRSPLHMGEECGGWAVGAGGSRCRQGVRWRRAQRSVLTGRRWLTIPHAQLAADRTQLGGVAGVR